MCANTSQNQPTEEKVDFILLITALGSISAIAMLILYLATTTMPSIIDFVWRPGEDLYRHPCTILSFTYVSSFPRVRLVSVSLPGYELRPRESSSAFRTSDPSVVAIRLPAGLSGYSASFMFDCFPLKGQPLPPQNPQVSFRMRWHRISWSRKRLLKRPSQAE